ncbi:DUF2254 domain-containing protein [Streptomyces antarcticus]|uniref:DUF2254 domain-containing protein n=1 Tax=Streptomyces antarcticus TaxID=2996458 RepID=UPI00226F6FC6|nr:MULTISPECIES: DUF2254 domain-containing protein [unclassified Streptomyces]MCY0940491.1 DUF2254 domain-containing protein [Streptomyces sp. H34-AA3]MCZ4082390.1 DUF2254 domain-containing protein [Streptomyces sp. H34-S5]
MVSLPGSRDALRAQLWPLPALGVVLAAGAGVGLPRLDARIQHHIPTSLAAYLFGGGPEAARTVLESITGSMITVTALTFSLTVVTLQLASSQFSPRLLRTFNRDRYVQRTLALFLATFTYALTVLRTVRTEEIGQPPFVPQLSVTVAFLLALASVLALVAFLSHLARKIRVETMLRDVHTDAEDTLRRILPEAGPGAAERPVSPRPPADAVPLPAGNSGFLAAADEKALLSAAVEADAVILIDRNPGSSLIAGTPAGVAWPRTGRSFTTGTRHRLVRQTAEALTTGAERTHQQDVGFGLRQLTDVACKALSPGVNDPTTAVHALSHCSALLCELAKRDPGPRLLADDDGHIRVVLRRPTLAELLDLVVAQPLRYGAADPAVLARILMLLRELAWHSAPGQHPAITDHLERVRSTAASQNFHPDERSELGGLFDSVEQALAGQWPPTAT